MKRTAGSSSLSLFCLRVCLVLSIISTFSLAEVSKHNQSKATYMKERFDSIKNSKKSTISPHQHENNKIDGNRNYSKNKSVMISDEKNSAALNRFLEDVLNAQNDLKWIDHVTRHINHRIHLNDPLAHTNQHSTVSINTRNILERDDIGYGSRLRGKRGFDRNYETMWMLQKKYGRKSTRDVPQRVYLDNDMTFNADNAFYQSHGTLDRAVYEEGTMVDQPLKDWTGKKNFHSSRDWSNSNENPKVTNGESTWLRDYESPENLVNSDSSKDEKLHVGLRDQFEVSLHDPIYANDLTALRRSPVAIKNGKTRNVPLSLESLKRTILELRDSLMLGYKRRNIIPKRESNWWDEPRSTAEMYNFGGDLDNYLDEETMRRLKRAKNVDNENEDDSKLFQGVEFGEAYFGGRNSKESHDRSKRNRRSFVIDSNYTNHQNDIPENSYRKIEIINNVLENVTTIQNTEVVTELYSNYLSNNRKNSVNALNITNSQTFLDKGSFSSNHFNNLTIIPSTANKANIFKLKYSSNTELYLNNHFFDNKSLFVIKTDLQTHLPEHITKNEVPKASSKKIGQRSTIKMTLKIIDHTAENRTNSPDFEKTAFTNLIDFSINDDSGKSLKNRSGGEKLGFAAQKISRLSIDDEQSTGAEKEFPRGNMSHGFGIGTNESWSSVVTTTVAAKEREIEADGTQNHEPISGVIKIFEPRGRLYQKQEAETTMRLSRQMGKDGTSVVKMKTNEDEVDESRNINAREDSLTSLIDSVTNATMKPETVYINTSETGESIILRDLTSVTVDNDLRRQQQMVPPLSVENRNANKSNGNLDTDKIDIRVLGSNGNETMNVKEVDGEIGDSSIKKMVSVFDTTTESHIESVNENRQQNKITDSANLGKILTRTKREDKAEESHIQDASNSQIAETNHNAHYEQSVYPYKNIDTNNEAENTAVEKEAAINYDENNEEYQNQNVEELKGFYNDREEEVLEDNDKAMERNREEQSSFRQQIDPVRAKVDMLIKQKLYKKKHKDSRNDRRKRHSMLDMVEYYDYDNDEEQERDASLNEQEAVNKDNKFSINAKIKRAGKSSCKSGDLGKKKNENAEAVMKEELRKAKAKYKEPKEEIVVDLGERKNKTTKKDQSDRKPLSSLGSSFENVFNEERQLLSKENSEKIRQSKDFANNVHQESTVAKSNWLDQPFEDRSASSKKNSELLLEDSKKETSNEPLEYISNADVNPNVVKNILLDIQPIKIMDQNKELETSKDFYEDFGNDRSEDYYYQENDANNVEFLYEELKNLYDWSDGELKSRPRLRGDQRLRYESDDMLDTNPSQLQPLNDRFLSSSQNDKTQKRFQSIDASFMNVDSNSTLASNYFALKVMNDMFKGDIEQSSTEENLPSSFTVRTTAKLKVSTVSEAKNVPLPEGRPIIDTDSETPYENTNESKTHKLLKQNLNLKEQAAISSQDLHESFVESSDWYDDFDIKVRLGRGLKAINDTTISDLLNAENATSLQIFHDNSSKSQNWHNNTITNSFNIFNNNHDVPDRRAKNVQESILMNTVNMDGDDLEQKYVNNQTSRIRRAAISYSTFYDNLNQNQHDYDETSRNLGNQFHPPNIVENQFDEAYDGYEIGNWNSDTQDRDRYSKIPRTNTRKKEKSGKGNKKDKHSSKKHAKKSSSHSSSNRNRRHHIQRSDMSKNRDDLKQKNKAEASPLIRRTKVQKSKTAEQGLLRARMNEALGEKVFYENAEDQSTVKPEVDDARRKEITLLLAADNIDDESQMDVALHGELAGKIVEQIFEQVQKNDRLKSVFGPGLHRDHRTEDVIRSNIYQQGLNKDGTNHTEMMIKKVMGLLDTLILNEVQKKTCVTLSPDMREFLGWMLEIDREEELLEEAPLLPLVREKIIPEQDTGRKFLFDSTSGQEREGNINDLQKKVTILETLVKEYNALTAKEKTKVQTVHDYLIRQLNLLLQYIEARETAETKGKPTSMFGAARARTGNVLQYQSAVPNAINASHSMTKDVLSLPIDTHNLFRFNNSFETIDKQLHDSHVAFGRRETRSTDNIPPKRRRRRKTKGQRFRNQKKNKNHTQSKQRHNEHRRHLDHVGSSPKHRKSRQKRANLEENDQASLYYLGYEKPRIYDSFDLLDAKLKRKRKNRKRELIDKKNAAIETDRILDLLPIKGKNRMEDEVILLNKREAWKRENEEQLEEVAFGKDMRNSTKRERERFEKLKETEGDKLKPPSINETSFRMKREDIIRRTSIGESTDRSNKSHAAFEIRDGESWNNSQINNGVKSENKLELVEQRINVFADNKTDAAIDFAATEVSAEEKLATNAGANNQIKGKLRAINRETKIDKTDGSTSFVNLTRNAKPRVSEERQKVSVTEKEADDNAVKLNRATNYRREEIDPEIELKNLRQEREKRIYNVANWKTGDYFYDDNLSRNKLREKYMAKLDELGDLDTDPENNLALLRLRNNKWLNDVVEWKLLPIIKQSPYDDYASSRIRLIEKETPIASNIKDMRPQSNSYLNSPKFWQRKYRKRNSVFDISPIFKITDNDHFPHRIHRKAKRMSEIARFKDLQVDPKIILKVQRLSRPWNNKRSDGVAEFGMPFILKGPNREFRETLRSHNHPELGDRVIYDGVGLQLPVWPYQYYDDFTDSSTFHFVPDIRGRGNEMYRYPAETYLEYGPFKKRHAHDANRRFARRNRFRLKTPEAEDTNDFPTNNLANKSSKFRFSQGKFRMEPATAAFEDYFVSGETKYTGKNARTNETKTKLTE